MTQQLSREDCLLMMREKAVEIDRLPKKADFHESEAARIKAFFGPWPKALEAAGLKLPGPKAKEEKKLSKRIDAKRKKTQNLRQKSEKY